MKDRYLFKAKRVDNGEWVVGYYQYCYAGYTHLISNLDGNYEVIPETICQCTGLKDKNGELIFEGDRFYGLDIGSSEIFVCEWDNEEGCYMFSSEDSENGIFNPREASEHLEHCGNIHDKE